MKRRDFIAMIGALSTALPRIARAQTLGMKRVAVLMNGTEADAVRTEDFAALKKELATLGWAEGKSLQIDVRWGGDTSAGFAKGARELIAARPDVIVATTTPGLMALRNQAGSIPVVFVIVTDPAGQGIVKDLARPEGSITGFTNYDAPMAGKWLGLLKEIAPEMRTVVPIFGADTAPYGPLLVEALRAASSVLDVEVRAAAVRSDEDIENAVRGIAASGSGGLIALPDTFIVSHRGQILALADRYRLPAMYPYSYFVRDGGLAAYGIVISDLFRRAADYVDRILRGAKPSELPVQAPAKFEFALNLRSAKKLGLAIPPMLVARADEVIE